MSFFFKLLRWGRVKKRVQPCIVLSVFNVSRSVFFASVTFLTFFHDCKGKENWIPPFFYYYQAISIYSLINQITRIDIFMYLLSK